MKKHNVKIKLNFESTKQILENTTTALCSPKSYEAVYHQSLHNTPMPSLGRILEFTDRLRNLLFPGYFSSTRVHIESMNYHVAANLDSIYRILSEQINAGTCFVCAEGGSKCNVCHEDVSDLALAFIKKLPEIRHLLSTDVLAAFEGDPATQSKGEVIFCMPSLYAMINHRIAHELYKLNVPLVPRMISEMAHSHTGIDIHPGATIGEEFFIDHGTGVVIGETCVIGKRCRLYQGVTLGALSFPKEADGSLSKGIPRHPILEDSVIVYAGATILGRVTIGANSTIGGNVWLTKSVEAGSRIMQAKIDG